jgi:diacylglycerol kinase (ATP)
VDEAVDVGPGSAHDRLGEVVRNADTDDGHGEEHDDAASARASHLDHRDDARDHEHADGAAEVREPAEDGCTRVGGMVRCPAGDIEIAVGDEGLSAHLEGECGDDHEQPERDGQGQPGGLGRGHAIAHERAEAVMHFEFVLHRARRRVDGAVGHLMRAAVHRDEDECRDEARRHTGEDEHDEYRHCSPYCDRATGLFPRRRARNRPKRRRGESIMTKRVAVIAHSGKQLGGGLDELRRTLHDRGVDAAWHEVPKSKKAPKQVRRVLKEGAELIYVWGGDGMVQRCAHEAAGTGATLAVIPAGTANLFASNLGIPQDLQAAVDIGLRGARRKLDLGTINGEHFAVMAGAGFDAAMIRDADAGLKDRIGRAAYVFTGAKNIRRSAVRARIKVDGEKFFDGDVSCVLAGNVGALFGGVTVFPDAEPDDGSLEVAVVTATNLLEWSRVLFRTARSQPADSPFVRVVPARSVRVRFDRPVPYELDGGDRPPTDRLKIDVEPLAVSVCVPAAAA